VFVVAEDFLSDLLASDDSFTSQKERELIRIPVIGSQAGVTETIQELHRLSFSPIDAWSKVIPIPVPGELLISYPGERMSILTRYRVGR
jgi:hypothetical protein